MSRKKSTFAQNSYALDLYITASQKITENKYSLFRSMSNIENKASSSWEKGLGQHITIQGWIRIGNNTLKIFANTAVRENLGPH